MRLETERWVPRLALITWLLVLALLAVSAYLRHSHVGSGCVDWPSCYGQIENSATALPAAPDTRAQQFWAKRTHKVIAVLIVLLVAVLVLQSIRRRHSGALLALPLLILFNLLLLSALGIVAGTSRSPIVTMGNLSGGVTLLCLTWWFYLVAGSSRHALPSRLRTTPPWWVAGLILTSAVVILGMFTSANYAALACSGLPDCNGAWWPSGALGEAINLVRPIATDDTGTVISGAAQESIQLAHRIGAFALVIWSVVLVARPVLQRALPQAWDLTFVLLLLLQYLAGTGLVLDPSSLTVAMAHNLGSSLLLVALLGAIHHHLAHRTTASPT